MVFEPPPHLQSPPPIFGNHEQLVGNHKVPQPFETPGVLAQSMALAVPDMHFVFMPLALSQKMQVVPPHVFLFLLPQVCSESVQGLVRWKELHFPGAPPRMDQDACCETFSQTGCTGFDHAMAQTVVADQSITAVAWGRVLFICSFLRGDICLVKGSQR